MKFRRRARRPRTPFDVTAYAAVFFLMVLMLLLGSRRYTPGVKIHLPVAGDLPGTDQRTVTVAMDESGRYYFDSQLIAEAALEVQFTNAVAQTAEPLTLVILADKRVPFESIKHLALLGRDAGIRDALAATLPRAVVTPCPAMNPAPTVSAERPWPPHRWVLFIGMAFAAHVGLIFAFGDRKPIVPRAVVNAPALQFTTQWSEREQLDDPTLFALPNPNGFAGAAWLHPPQIEFAPFRWTEPPRLLALSGAQLGLTFQQHRTTNQSVRLELEPLPPPELTQIRTGELTFIMARHSRARLGDNLAQRAWLNAPSNLPPQFAADLLTNSVVQVWVEADGQVLSPALLPPGSGPKEADQLALKIARAARFAPLPRGGAKVTHSVLIFEWHTVSPTNATPAPP